MIDTAHYLIGTPFLSAMVIALFPQSRARAVATLLGLFGIIVNCVCVYMKYVSGPRSIDSVSFLFVTLTAVTVMAAILLTPPETHSKNRFYSLIFLTQMGLNIAFIETTALWFYVGWEAALIPSLVMIVGWGGDNRRSAATRFLLYTLVGSLMMLGSILTLYLHYGTTDWNILSTTIIPGWLQLVVFCGFFAAFAVKLPVFPLHSWQASTYLESNIPTGVILSAIFSKLGVYGLYRLVTILAPDISFSLATPVICVCIFGSIYSAVAAFGQSNLKRVIAFASMSHINTVAAAMFASPTLGITGALIFSVSHTVISIGLWWAVAILKRRFGHTRLHEITGGIVAEHRFFTAVMFIITLSAMAVPLTSGFPGEFLMLQSIIRYKLALGILATFPMVLGAIYMLRAYHTLMLGKPNTSHGPVTLTASETIIGGTLGLAIIIIGVYPQFIFQLLTHL